MRPLLRNAYLAMWAVLVITVIAICAAVVPLIHDYRIEAQFRHSANCDEFSSYGPDSPSTCSQRPATVVSVNYGDPVSVTLIIDGQQYTADGVSDQISGRRQTTDVNAAILWHGDVVAVSDGSHSEQTTNNPDNVYFHDIVVLIVIVIVGTLALLVCYGNILVQKRPKYLDI